MSKYDRFGDREDIDAQNPLSPPQISNNDSLEKLNPNSAFSIVKNKIFEMYKIHNENKKNQNK